MMEKEDLINKARDSTHDCDEHQKVQHQNLQPSFLSTLHPKEHYPNFIIKNCKKGSRYRHEIGSLKVFKPVRTIK